MGGLTGLQLRDPERARQHRQRGLGWQLEEWEERGLAEGGGGYVDMYSLGSDMRILGLGLLSLKIK